MSTSSTSRLPASLMAMAWACLATVCTSAHAQDAAFPGGLRINGFGTLGVTSAHAPDGWGFNREASQPVNDGGVQMRVDSRLGVQANYAFNDQLELVGQVVVKDRVGRTPPSDALEWAFVSYQPAADWTIRAGRINPDLYALSDYRNVGFAYPWARPNVEFYGFLSIYSMQGVDVAKVWNLDDVRWRAKLAVAGGAHVYGAEREARGSQAFTAMVSRESAGLKLRASVVRFDARFSSYVDPARWLNSLAALQALPMPDVAAQAGALLSRLQSSQGAITYASLGVSYDLDDWLLAAEIARSTSRIPQANGAHGYLSIGRRFGDFTLYGMLGRGRSSAQPLAAPDWASSLAPLIGPDAAHQAQMLGAQATYAVNRTRQDQRSAALGVRWDLHAQVALKLQWDHYRIGATGSVLWSQGTPQPASANVGSLVLDFVF